MTRRAFLHIGLPKTGTTFLQDVVWSQRDQLGSAGLLIPGRHRRRHLLASLEVREDARLEKRAGDTTAPWQELVDECRDHDGDILITHEFFAAASPRQIRRMAEDFADRDLHVIITARAMVDLGISRWQEWVRNGGNDDIDSFPVRSEYDPTDEWGWGSCDLADVLERWGSVLPHDRIHVLPMAPGRSAAHDLWLSFAGVLGLDGSRYPAPESERNQSLGLVETEVLRRINADLTNFRSAGDRGRWIRGYLAQPDLMKPSGERFRPGPETLADLEARGRRGVAMLQDGGYDVVGDLALLEPSEVSGLRHPSEVTDAEMLEFTATVVAALLDRARTLTRKCAHLESRLETRPDGLWRRVVSRIKGRDR